MGHRQGSSTGLVVYSGSTHLVMPLTTDPDIITYFASSLSPDLMPVSGDDPVQAVEMAARWPGKISPAGVLNYAEEEARGVFQSGNAVFMRNWPYAWNIFQRDESAVKDKIGIIAMPHFPAGEPASTLGGWPGMLAGTRPDRRDYPQTLNTSTNSTRTDLGGFSSPATAKSVCSQMFLAWSVIRSRRLKVLRSAKRSRTSAPLRPPVQPAVRIPLGERRAHQVVVIVSTVFGPRDGVELEMMEDLQH